MTIRHQLVRIMSKFFYPKTNIDTLLTDKTSIRINKSQIDDFPETVQPASHGHGNISSDGKIGSTANLPVITGTNGVIQVGSFEGAVSNIKMNGTAKVGSRNTFARGDHVHPTDDTRASAVHVHGDLNNDGTLSNDIESVNKIVVTNNNNFLKTIGKLPFNKLNITLANLTDLGVPAQDTTYVPGTGLGLNGNAFNHSNSVTPQNMSALRKIRFDSEGHITGADNVSGTDLPAHTNNTGSNIGQASASVFGHVKASGIVGSADTVNGSVGTVNGVYANADHTHEKSSLYAEASHQHPISDITNLPVSTANLYNWAYEGVGNANTDRCKGYVSKQGNIVVMHLELYSRVNHGSTNYYTYVSQGIPVGYRPANMFYHTFANYANNDTGTVKIHPDGTIDVRTGSSNQSVFAIFNIVYMI